MGFDFFFSWGLAGERERDDERALTGYARFLYFFFPFSVFLGALCLGSTYVRTTDDQSMLFFNKALVLDGEGILMYQLVD